MSFFTSIKSFYKKAEAAVIVQNYLEKFSSFGSLALASERLPSQIIEDIWKKKPDLFNGCFGFRPHKIAVVASAFANAIDFFPVESQDRDVMMLVLGEVLSEVQVNGAFYQFNNIDNYLIDFASSVYSTFLEEQSESFLFKSVE